MGDTQEDSQLHMEVDPQSPSSDANEESAATSAFSDTYPSQTASQHASLSSSDARKVEVSAKAVYDLDRKSIEVKVGLGNLSDDKDALTVASRDSGTSSMVTTNPITKNVEKSMEQNFNFQNCTFNGPVNMGATAIDSQKSANT